MNKNIDSLVDEGLEFLNGGEYEKAESYFNKIIEIDNNYAQAYYFRGYCYTKMKKYQRALTDLDKSIKLDASDSRVYFYRNQNIQLLKSNNCKSNLSKELSVEDTNIKVEDFNISNNIGTAEVVADFVIWHNYMHISLEINLKDKDTFDNNKIENYIKEFKEHLIWLENNKKAIINALIEDGMIELAEEWVESSEEKIIDGEKVYVYGDNIFNLPITEEEFFKSLYFNSMELRIDENKDIADSRILMEICIDTNPDYFAGHSMDITVIDGYKILVNGLAG